MDGRSRIQISALIWIGYILVMVIALPIVAPQGNFISGGIVAAATFAVMMSMGFVWSWGRLGLTSSAIDDAEKSKRLSRAGKILASLSEEDLNLLRERLSEDDEQVGIRTLLREDGELHRGR